MDWSSFFLFLCIFVWGGRCIGDVAGIGVSLRAIHSLEFLGIRPCTTFTKRSSSLFNMSWHDGG